MPYIDEERKKTLGARSSAVEHSAHNRQRAGSNPAGPTIKVTSREITRNHNGYQRTIRNFIGNLPPGSEAYCK